MITLPPIHEHWGALDEMAVEVSRDDTSTAQSGGTFWWPPEGIGMTVISYDPQVEELLAGDYDEADELVASLQSRLRTGDLRLASELLEASRSTSEETDARCLAIEALASAKSRLVEPMAFKAVQNALESIDPRIQFAGIAAASDLARQNQVFLSRIIKTLEGSSQPAVARAAGAFIRRRTSLP